MNHGKYVRVSSFIPQRAFDNIVRRYHGDYRVRHFTCWNQLMCMMYGQLSNRDSLSDLVLTVNAHTPKAYHLGLGKGVSKTKGVPHFFMSLNYNVGRIGRYFTSSFKLWVEIFVIYDIHDQANTDLQQFSRLAP
jgi:hypothetical protein